MPRIADIQRDTNETRIKLTLQVDGTGRAEINTGVGFFDHMLDLLTRHSLIDLSVNVIGDLHVDAHHTVEDVGLVLGQAIAEAMGDKRGIYRYGWARVPMDESLADVSIDLGGRPVLVYHVPFRGELIGTFASELVEEFCRGLATAAKMNLHVTVPYGSNNHHMAEAVFKAMAKALRQAVDIDPRNPGVPSTKGVL